MTASLVRDTIQDGLWHVFVDGFAVGELYADDSDLSFTTYGFSTEEIDVQVGYPTLADALTALIRTRGAPRPR